MDGGNQGAGRGGEHGGALGVGGNLNCGGDICYNAINNHKSQDNDMKRQVYTSTYILGVLE